MTPIGHLQPDTALFPMLYLYHSIWGRMVLWERAAIIMYSVSEAFSRSLSRLSVPVRMLTETAKSACRR